MRRIFQPASLALAALLLAACTAPQPNGGAAAPRTAETRPTMPTAPAAQPAPAPRDAAPPTRPASSVGGVPDLDRSCRVDSDCAVKDVGNCCGYFPACVNTAAQPDPRAVQAACADSGMAGVCGFREIEACACVSNTCEPAQSGAAVAR